MKCFYFTLLIFVNISLAQTKDDVIKNIRDFDFSAAKKNTAKIASKALANQFLININLNEIKGISLKNDTIKKISVDDNSIKKSDTYLYSLFHLNKGLYELYIDKGNKSNAFQHLNIALNSAIKIQNKPLICEVIKAFLFYFKTVIIIDDLTYTKYLKIYKQYIYDKTEEKNYLYYKTIIPFQRSSDSKVIRSIVPDLFYLTTQNLSKPYLGNVYLRIGNYYQTDKQMKDSAMHYYNKAIALFPNPKKGFEFEQFIKYKSNYSMLLTELNEYRKSNSILFNLRNNFKGKIHKRNKIYLDYYIAKNFYKLKQFDSAYIYLNKSRKSQFKLNQNLHLTSLNEINTKYETEKKEKENLQLQSNVEKEQRQKKNLLYGSLALLLFGGITTTLFLKNSKRKRLLAEKNKEIEQQKVITLLKEQELTSIDAMIEGQEKERKRIAEDLHDDLGSVLTTLKLHFENYKVNKDKKKFQEDELINKTDALIDEAYKKVRSIAHAKNSGVIANQGLLLAIENMAEKVSAPKKIKIDVVNHGLENRLENSLELTIFRIIQELITNIIKHASATEATIHIINHDKSLNIMVEDNGKGFNTSQISSKGMGIHSIDKRIEHLNGTMTIESEINKGTTVIIDIPL